MQILTSFILDDSETNIAILSQMIGKTEAIVLSGSSTNPFEYLNKIKAGLKTDIIFLDIEMPGINGIELAGLLPARTSIIFITAHEEFAVSAWQKNGVDYLVKPVEYRRFILALEKVRLMIEGRKAIELKESLLEEVRETYHSAASATAPAKSGRPSIVHTRKGYFFSRMGLKSNSVKHNYNEILYIKGMGTYIQIYYKEGRREDLKYSLSTAEKEFPVSFIRIHRSHIVNTEHIQSFSSRYVILNGGTELAIGAEYRDNFLRNL